MCSLGVWAGAIPIQKVWGLRGILSPSGTLHSELQRHGCLDHIACSSDPATGYALRAHFELQIG
ncbi:hypothetical protein PDIG_87390 [Penicillium digitatum PHI26]|uniref:Uncharacterized protein n=2 Tax=Penicillium digitatum TaxID=36651 RepID=K9F9K6_PEND2|nr:hypothetical protein PDIP_33420 [Penicillium digitatum Pd1]EKV04747.1 hypothetical protein PDIG_87390 [Penicillium digitatum PHI26]EKV16975.1 hypothetical protein PDIP_33420 [Penicillium digitatum Pd1]